MKTDKRIAVVTGSAKWLGREYAHQLAGAGDHVVIADIDDEGAAEVVREIAEAGGDATAVHLDVGDEVSVADAFALIARELGEVAVLVNNAGGVVAQPGPAEELSVGDWNRMLAINLTGSWLCARAVIPTMKAARRGRIINIGSVCFTEGLPLGMTAYVAAKGGIVGLSRSLAREKIRDLVVGRQCLPRDGERREIASAVVYLASDAAAFITGQTLNVDGGWDLT